MDGDKRRGQRRSCYKVMVRGELSERCAPGYKGIMLEGTAAMITIIIGQRELVSAQERKQNG